MTTRRAAVFFAVLSSVLSSLAWVFQGAAVDLLTPLPVVAAQGVLTGAIYLLHLGPSKEKIPFVLIKRHAKDLALFILMRGVISGILLCYALSLSGSIKVMFFTKLEPYFILFWSWLILGERISRYHLGLLLIHIGGAVLLSTGGTFRVDEGQIGDLLLVFAVALLSFSYLFASRLARVIHPAHLNGVTALGTGLCLLPVALVFAPRGAWNPLSPGWLYLFGLVVMYNVISQTLWYAALRTLESWLVSALRAVGPVLAAPIAWLFFEEQLTLLQVLGAFVVLATSALLARDRGGPAIRAR